MNKLLISFAAFLCAFVSSYSMEPGFQSDNPFSFLPPGSDSGMSIDFYSSGSWTASSNASWLSLDESSGTDDGQIEYSVTENDTGSPRIGLIQSGEHSFEVIQSPKSSVTLYGLGNNIFSQISGDGVPEVFSTPQVFRDGAKDIRAGSYGVLILDENGKLWGFGSLALAFQDGRESSFVLIDENVESIDMGYDVYMYKKFDGSLWSAVLPREPEWIANDVASFAAGWGNYFYITDNGDLFGFAYFSNSFGQLGIGSSNVPSEPAFVASNVVQASLGVHNGAFVTADNKLYGMGAGWSGVFGSDFEDWFTSQLSPRLIAEGVDAVEVGDSAFMLAKKLDGHLYRLEGGTLELVLEDVESFDIEIGFDGAGLDRYVRTQSGESFMWGAQENGEYGIGDWGLFFDEPQSAGFGIQRFGSYNFSGMGVFLLESGEVAFAGRDLFEVNGPQNYQLPHAHTRSDVKSISSNGFTGLYVTESSDLYMLGRNFSESLKLKGDPVYTTPEMLNDGVADIAIGNGTVQGVPALILYENGSLYKQGYYSRASLQLDVLNIPELVATGVIDMALGLNSSNIYYVDDLGDLYGIGSNYAGQLGLEDTNVDTSDPVMIASEVAEVFAGNGFVAYIDQSGNLWTLGLDSEGLIGDGESEQTYSSTPYLLDTNVIDVAIAYRTMLYVKADGSLKGHGLGNSGELGINSNEVVTSPMVLADNVVAAWTMSGGSVFLNEDGMLYSFGNSQRSSVYDSKSNKILIPRLVDSGVTSIYDSGVTSLFYTKKMALVTDQSFVQADTSYEESWYGFDSTIRVFSDEPWVARSQEDWIELVDEEGEAGESELRMMVAANVSAEPRTGFISISGTDVQVYQEGIPAIKIGILGDAFELEGTQFTSDVTYDWIHYEPVEAMGIGNVVVDKNLGSEPRSAMFAVGGFTYIIEQEGNEGEARAFGGVFEIEVGNGASAGQSDFDLVESSTIVSSKKWIQITSAPMAEAGPGTVDYEILENPYPATRVGFIEVGGSSLRITQAPATEYATFAIGDFEFDATERAQSVVILSNTNWTISSDSNWLAVTSSLLGSGDGKMRFSVTRNQLPISRTAIVSLGKSELAVTQLGTSAGFYLSDEDPQKSSIGLLDDIELSSYAGLWLSDDGMTGKLIGLCVGETESTGFVYDLEIESDEIVYVHIDDETTNTLSRDEFGVLSGTIPCIGEISFSKVVVGDDETDNTYSGFYEEDSGDPSGAKVYVLVTPAGDAIAVAPELPESFAVKGKLAANGSLIVTGEAAASKKSVRLVVNTSNPGSGLILKTTALGSTSQRSPAAGEVFTIDVDSIGAWAVVETEDWLTTDIASGSGTGSVEVTVSANEGATLRIASIAIGSESTEIRQLGNPDGLAFADWLKAYFTAEEIAAMGESPEIGDNDYDGTDNESEWALSLDPGSFASRLEYDVVVMGEELEINFQVSLPAGVSIVIEKSSDLSTWIDAGASLVSAAGETPRYSFAIGETLMAVRVRAQRSE